MNGLQGRSINSYRSDSIGVGNGRSIFGGIPLAGGYSTLPNMELLTHTISDQHVIDRVVEKDIEFYSGGVVLSVPERIYVVMGDTYGTQDGEVRVKRILSRLKLPCGVNIALVGGQAIATGAMIENYVVPSGVKLHGYRQESIGVYVRDPAGSCVTQYRFVVMTLDQYYPCYPLTGWFKTLRYGFRLSWYLIRRWFNTYIYDFGFKKDSLVRVDMSLYMYLYTQRLGTSSSLNTAAVHRIIESSAIKKSTNTIHQSTLKTTVDYFINHQHKYSTTESLEDCVIEDLSTFPALVEPEVVAISVGQGYLLSSENEVKVTVVDNHNFKVKMAKGITFQDGEIHFEEPYHVPAHCYMYGPHPASAAAKFSVKSTVNIENAVKRLFNSRGLNAETMYQEEDYRKFGDFALMCALGYNVRVSKEVRDTSIKFGAFNDWGLHFNSFTRFKQTMPSIIIDPVIKTGLLMQGFVAEIKKISLRDFSQEIDTINCLNYVENIKNFAEEEHIKRDERVATFHEMVDMPWKFDPLLKPVEGKVKWELGKHNKLTRLFVSLGCCNTLYAPQIPRILKEIMDRRITLSYFHDRDEGSQMYNLHYRFWKQPEQAAMNEWASQVVECQKDEDVFLNYHSDDSHLSVPVRIGTATVRVNVCVDISKCDLSHSPGLFVFMAHMCKECGFDPVKVDELFQQLQSDVIIKHPNKNVDAFIIMAVRYMVLFSGSVLTTVVNNGGSLFILTNIVINLLNRIFVSEDEVKNCVLKSAAQVGYEVTIDAIAFSCDPIETVKLTFLKHFPTRDLAGNPVALRDLSTMIRGLGISDTVCDCKQRLQEIVGGWRTSPFSDLLLIIFEAVELPTYGYDVTISSQVYADRYSISIQQLMEGLHLLFSCREAALIAHPALDAILDVGYALPRMRDISSTDIYSGREPGTHGGGLK